MHFVREEISCLIISRSPFISLNRLVVLIARVRKAFVLSSPPPPYTPDFYDSPGNDVGHMSSHESENFLANEIVTGVL